MPPPSSSFAFKHSAAAAAAAYHLGRRRRVERKFSHANLTASSSGGRLLEFAVSHHHYYLARHYYITHSLRCLLLVATVQTSRLVECVQYKQQRRLISYSWVLPGASSEIVPAKRNYFQDADALERILLLSVASSWSSPLKHNSKEERQAARNGAGPAASRVAEGPRYQHNSGSISASYLCLLYI